MTPEVRITLERILQDVREINDYFKSGKVQEAALKTLGHTTGIIIRLERELSTPSPAPEVMGTPEPLFATDAASQRQIDIINLRLYARLAQENEWPDETLHWSVFEHTLNAIATRLERLPQPDPWVDVKVGLPPVHKVDYDEFSESDEVLILLKDKSARVAQYSTWPNNVPHPGWSERSGDCHWPEDVTHWRGIELPLLGAPGSENGR